MTRWGEKHNKALKAIFESEDIDEKRQDNSYIEKVWDSLPADNYLKVNTADERFCHHWKEKSQLYMTQRALGGERCKALEAAAAKQEVHEDEEEEEEEEEEEKKYYPPVKTEWKMSKKVAPKGKPKSDYQSDEKPWIPVYSMHQYQQEEYDRIAVVIDAPQNFTGKKGTYRLFVDNQMTLVLKVPIDTVHTDPHHVHSLLCAEFGRTFSADSAKESNWKSVTHDDFEDARLMVGTTAFDTFLIIDNSFRDHFYLFPVVLLPVM